MPERPYPTPTLMRVRLSETANDLRARLLDLPGATAAYVRPFSEPAELCACAHLVMLHRADLSSRPCSSSDCRCARFELAGLEYVVAARVQVLVQASS